MTTPLLYCDKPSVNRLTALLCRTGLRDVVVCPGSRNGVRNYFAACYSVIAEEKFGIKAVLAECCEEAACGAARSAGAGIGWKFAADINIC